MQGKPVSDSAIHDQTALVFPNDLNSHGTLFGGRVLDLADRLAAVVARRHSGRICVTLAIDSVRFLAPAGINDILVLQASVNRAWSTSMEIGLRAEAEDVQTGQRRHIFSAYFTYVALGDDHRPVPVSPVIPQTPGQQRRYEQADCRRQLRLSATCKGALHP